MYKCLLNKYNILSKKICINRLMIAVMCWASAVLFLVRKENMTRQYNSNNNTEFSTQSVISVLKTINSEIYKISYANKLEKELG